MTNKYIGFTLKTVHALFKQSAYLKMENMLVDVENNQLIHATYSLTDPKNTGATKIDCCIVNIPIKIIDKNTVEIDGFMLYHKLNNKHYKKADYDELCFHVNRDFSVFM